MAFVDTCFNLNASNSSYQVSDWFVREGTNTHPRENNLITPLINGQATFSRLAEAICQAKKSIDIICWGFEPNMVLEPPHGKTLAQLLEAAAVKPDVSVRIMGWFHPLGYAKEENLVGAGIGGSGGTSVGSGSASGSFAQSDQHDWILRAIKGHITGIQFVTRKVMLPNSHLAQLQSKYPEISNSPGMEALLYHVPSHHQKNVLIDYDHDDSSKAIGFVMGHNLLSAYWDDDTHAYSNDARKISGKSEYDGRLGPWHDISSELKGPCLVDVNRNFTEAWDHHTNDTLAQQRQKLDADPLRYAQNHYLSQAQICLTFPRLGDYSIEELYYNAISRASYFIYIENQYFRNPRIAEAIKERQLELAKHCNKKLYVVIITNPASYVLAKFTRDTFRALNKFESLETPKDVVVNTASDAVEAVADSAVVAGQWTKDTVRESYAGAKEGLGGLSDATGDLLRQLGENAEQADWEWVNDLSEPLKQGGEQLQQSADVLQKSAEQTQQNIEQDQQDRETQKLYEELMDTGARVLLAIMKASNTDTPAKYRDIYVHAKTLIVDDAFYTIGSANINIRSLHVDTEVNIAVRDNNQGDVAKYRNDLWRIALDGMYGDIIPKELSKNISEYWGNAFAKWSEALKDNDRKYSSNEPLVSRVLTYDQNTLPLPDASALD
jgi:phosphatidylserine/phosphatidylglycerophosphate/cardiolipin synthase-like enzyme